MKNIYEKSSAMLSDILSKTKTNSLLYINIATLFGCIVQFILTFAYITADPTTISNLVTFISYNSNLLTTGAMVPFISFFVIKHFKRGVNNTREDDEKMNNVNINVLVAFILSFLFQMVYLSDGAYVNFLQSIGLISIVTYISGLTRNIKHTIATFVIACMITIGSIMYHDWGNKYVVMIDPITDRASYEYVTSKAFKDSTDRHGSSLSSPLFDLQTILTEGIILLIFTIVTTKSLTSIRKHLPTVISDIEKTNTEMVRLQAVEDTTKEIQRLALPQTPSIYFNTVAMDSGVLPSGKCGGDFFDVFQTPSGDIIFWMGDVVGHGLMASIVMSLVQSSINTCIRSHAYECYGNDIDLKKLYDMTNSICHGEMVRKFDFPHPTSLVMCMLRGDTLTYIGQHEKFFIKTIKYNSSEKIVVVKNTMELGIPFGLQQDISSYTKIEKIRLRKGDELLFFTDGITDAINKNKEAFGIDRLIEAFENSKSINTIITDALAWCENTQEDDITLLHLKLVL